MNYCVCVYSHTHNTLIKVYSIELFHYVPYIITMEFFYYSLMRPGCVTHI